MTNSLRKLYAPLFSCYSSRYIFRYCYYCFLATVTVNKDEYKSTAQGGHSDRPCRLRQRYTPTPSDLKHWNKKLGCRKETVRLLRGLVLAKYNLKSSYGLYILNHCDVIGGRAFLTGGRTDGQNIRNTVRCITCSRDPANNNFRISPKAQVV